MKIVNFKWFSVAKGGRNNTGDTTVFVVFVATSYIGVKISQEFVALTAMKGTTECAHVNKVLRSVGISMHNAQWRKAMHNAQCTMAEQQRHDEYQEIAI
jgi:hypothetical protein